jgi:hypothetical protein
MGRINHWVFAQMDFIHTQAAIQGQMLQVDHAKGELPLIQEYNVVPGDQLQILIVQVGGINNLNRAGKES